MNKKIIGILSAVTLLGGAVYLSGQGGFGSLSSSVLSEEEVCSIESYEEQISTIENNIVLAQEKIQTQQQSIQKNNENITTLSQKLRERKVDLKQAQANKKKCSTGRSTNQACVKQADTYIGNLQDTIKNLENKIKENKDAIAETKKNITTQQKNIKKWKIDIVSLSQEKAECGDIVDPETGGDLPPAGPETGGDLPPYVPETGGDLPASSSPIETPSSIPQIKTDESTTPVPTNAEEVNKEIKSLALEINTAGGNITPEKMQNIANRFDILNKAKSDIENDPLTNNKQIELASAEKLYAEIVNQARQSRYLWDNVLLPREKDLQAKEWDLDAKIAAAKNQNQKQDLIKKRQEIREKIKANNAEMAKYLNESQQMNTQMTQLQVSIQEIKSKTVVIPRIEQEFFDHVQMTVDSFRTGGDNQKCEQYAHLGSILPQVDAIVIDTSLQYPETRLISFMKTPLPAAQLAEAKSLYSEIHAVLLNLKNSITAYDTQRADYMKKVSSELSKVPSYCFQLHKKIKAERELLPKNDATYSSGRKQVIVLERFTTWMEQNHLTGNN